MIGDLACVVNKPLFFAQDLSVRVLNASRKKHMQKNMRAKQAYTICFAI